MSIEEEETGMDEWDQEFLAQLEQVEQLALSSATQQPHFSPPPALSSATQQPHFSPPRALSQRTTTTTVHPSFIDIEPPTSLFRDTSSFDNRKDKKIQKPKSELGRVSEQLTDLICLPLFPPTEEEECSGPRKEIDKKEQRQLLNCGTRGNGKNAADVCHLGIADGESGDHILGNHVRHSKRSKTLNVVRKEVGIQTEKIGDCPHVALDDKLHRYDLSKKLVAIWGSPGDRKTRKHIVSNTVAACLTDLHSIFGSFGNNSSQMVKGYQAVESCSYHSQTETSKSNASEATKVARLCDVLTKITCGLAQLEALFEPLLDLCLVENVIVVQKSMHIFHMILKNVFSSERKCTLLGDNVLIEGLDSQNVTLDHYAYESRNIKRQITVNGVGTRFGHHIPGISDTDMIGGEKCNRGIGVSVSHVNWVSLFEALCKIAISRKEECIVQEAVSIMNMILMTTNAYMEREKFGKNLVFECIGKLTKDAGICVRKQAVQLLFLLLNCPKLLAVFFSCWKIEGGDASARDNDSIDTLTSQQCSTILEGLANCVAIRGNSLEDVMLCRNAVIVLAFLASSGGSGFDIFLTHKLTKETNFLRLILQVLVSGMDTEAVNYTESLKTIKERTMLTREALILLNRLVSNSASSSTVLQVLTSSRDMASLTIDVANGLSRREQTLKSSGGKFSAREPEIVELARVFKKRVFACLGDPLL